MLKALRKRYGDLTGLLECPDCCAPLRAKGEVAAIDCAGCGRTFEFEDDILLMMPSDRPQRPIQYSDPDYTAFKRLFELEDADAAHYANFNPAFRAVHNAAHELAHGFYRRGKGAGWVADLACGTGDHLGYFKNADRLVGIDSSLGSLKSARRHRPEVPLVQGDVLRLPLRDGVVRFIFSIHALEHLQMLDEAVAEMDRVMARAGRLYVGLPAEGGWLYALGRRLTVQRTFNRRFGFNYARAISIDHCNTASRVMTSCRRGFSVRHVRFSPFPFLTAVGPNVAVALECAKHRAGSGNRRGEDTDG